MRLKALLLAAALFSAGCHAAKKGGSGELKLSLDPPTLQAGALITVTAEPFPRVELAWVSGTVKVMSAPVLPFKRDFDGKWKFKTMIPSLVTIPSGTYEARAWGATRAGEPYEGSLKVVVQ